MAAKAAWQKRSLPINGALMPFLSGESAAGMLLTIAVNPTNVSFSRVECLELPGPATDVKGYFTRGTYDELKHSPTTAWIKLSSTNLWMDRAVRPPLNKPWYYGAYTWVIPVRWRVEGKTRTQALPDRVQVFTLHGSDGTVSVSKLGVSVTRTPK